MKHLRKLSLADKFLSLRHRNLGGCGQGPWVSYKEQKLLVVAVLVPGIIRQSWNVALLVNLNCPLPHSSTWAES